MKASWVGRQIAAFLLLAVTLVLASGFIELISAVRLAARQAEVEADLVAGSVRRELARIAVERDLVSPDQIAGEPALEAVLADALVLAPSVLFVAVLSPEGTVVAHTQPARIGAIEPPYPALPKVSTVPGALSTLLDLRRNPPTYQKETSIALDRQPFATIRVAIGGAFVWAAVRGAVGRGLWTAAIGIGAALAAGFLVARVFTGPVRALERDIAALSEGKLDALPESGIDEFARLARSINLLGARLSRSVAPPEENAPAAHPAPAADPRLAGLSLALERLGEIAAGLAHELRNELQSIQLNLGILQRLRSQNPEEIRRHADEAARSVATLDSALRGFLKIARLRPPAPQTIQINGLLEEVRLGLRTEAGLAGISIDLELDPALPETQADPEVLRQAVQNLVRNAVQALGGTDDGRILLRSSHHGEDIWIIVKDNGPGIPPETQARMFDLFFTTRTNGTGVGLALVRQSIEMHGGRARIESQPGEGTEVVLEVPCRS